MDKYTQKTKEWLDSRFKSSDRNGVYQSHSPIYGFSHDFLALGLYKNNYNILNEIRKIASQFSINNILEVGCAEGYTAYLIREIFKFSITVCDLSFEAVKRAKEIYGLQGIVADIQELSNIKSDSYDLVICSETIEHIPNPDRAIEELKRISKKAIIITVPAAISENEKVNYIPTKEPHAHLNIFTKSELISYLGGGSVRGISFSLLNKFELLITDHNMDEFYSRKKYLLLIYKTLKLIFFPIKKLYGFNIATFCIKLDYFLCKIFPGRVFTYLAIYTKKIPEFKKYKNCKYKKLINFMLRKSKVKPYYLLD